MQKFQTTLTSGWLISSIGEEFVVSDPGLIPGSFLSAFGTNFDLNVVVVSLIISNPASSSELHNSSSANFACSGFAIKDLVIGKGEGEGGSFLRSFPGFSPKKLLVWLEILGVRSPRGSKDKLFFKNFQENFRLLYHLQSRWWLSCQEIQIEKSTDRLTRERWFLLLGLR